MTSSSSPKRNHMFECTVLCYSIHYACRTGCHLYTSHFTPHTGVWDSVENHTYCVPVTPALLPSTICNAKIIATPWTWKIRFHPHVNSPPVQMTYMLGWLWGGVYSHVEPPWTSSELLSLPGVHFFPNFSTLIATPIKCAHLRVAMVQNIFPTVFGHARNDSDTFRH